MNEKEKIALYGLGTETERNIPDLEKQYEIVGLLDGFKTDGDLFGKRILPIDEAIEMGISRIIVVARPGSCKAIAKRIGDKCLTSGVELYDIRHLDLLNQSKNIYDTDKVEDVIKNSVHINPCDRSDKIKRDLFLKRIKKMNIKGGKCQINDVSDIGYLLCAPLITDFTLWLYQNIKYEEIKNIWFSARDGFLIKKLFAILDPSMNTTYFLTSRCAAIRAGIQTNDDINYVDSMKYSGSLKENIKTRFGIDISEETVEGVGMLKYKDSLLKKSAESRKGYQEYMKTLDLAQGNVALFDFVAKGTIQYFVGKLLPNRIKGFYFLQLEPDFMKSKNLDIASFYSEEEKNGSAIFDNYYILETILTSPDPSAIDFDESGKPVYAEETRKKDEIECFGKIQEGIIEYFKDYIEVTKEDERTINKLYDEEFLRLIYNVKITDEIFLGLTIEDPFFGRMTDIKDVI